MARPTMSKMLYTQQLGRGMRNAPGKNHLMVFDFVDNANQYNTPYSLHRLLHLDKYRPGQLALANKENMSIDEGLYAQGEKPEAIISYPVNVQDLETVDVFNWQDEARDMVSQMEFIRRVDVQEETISRYIQTGKLIPDLIVPVSENKTLRYFREETLQESARIFGWTLIDDDNRKDLFMEMIHQMDMSYSYKPVLIKAILKHADTKGRIQISDIILFFREFYDNRRKLGDLVEKSNSLFCRESYSDKEAEHKILSMPFARFEGMQMMRHSKTLGTIEMETSVWKRLTDDEKKQIESICDAKLNEYYQRLNTQK